MLCSEQRWKSLPEHVRQAMMQAEREAREYQRVEYLKEDADTVRLLREKGVTFTSPDPAPFREIARNRVYPAVITDNAQKALTEEIAKL